MNPLQIILDFFKEIINRIGTKSPAFFKVLMVFAASLTFAGYVPSMLQQWFKVDVSGGVISFCEALAKYSTGFFLASATSTKAPIVGQTESGMEVKVTNERKMPFTAKAEKKEIEKVIPPPDVIEDIKVDTSQFPDTSGIPKTENKP